jgi:hypothetical protein
MEMGWTLSRNMSKRPTRTVVALTFTRSASSKSVDDNGSGEDLASVFKGVEFSGDRFGEFGVERTTFGPEGGLTAEIKGSALLSASATLSLRLFLALFVLLLKGNLP